VRDDLLNMDKGRSLLVFVFLLLSVCSWTLRAVCNFPNSFAIKPQCLFCFTRTVEFIDLHDSEHIMNISRRGEKSQRPPGIPQKELINKIQNS
jgi:hypothetical protein